MNEEEVDKRQFIPNNKIQSKSSVSSSHNVQWSDIKLIALLCRDHGISPRCVDCIKSGLGLLLAGIRQCRRRYWQCTFKEVALGIHVNSLVKSVVDDEGWMSKMRWRCRFQEPLRNVFGCSEVYRYE